MSDFSNALLLVIAHLRCAGYAALVFVLGFVSSISVVRYQIKALLIFPRWVVKKLQVLLAARALGLFLFIFGFNSIAMCLYMLSGAIHYVVPVLIAFMTGTNIGIISLLAITEKSAPIPPLEPRPRRQRIAMLCGALTATLEIPSFWIAIAMGMTLGGFGAPAENVGAQAMARLNAYCHVIVPVLLVSAAVETLGIKLMIAEGGKENQD